MSYKGKTLNIILYSVVQYKKYTVIFCDISYLFMRNIKFVLHFYITIILITIQLLYNIQVLFSELMLLFK